MPRLVKVTSEEEQKKREGWYLGEVKLSVIRKAIRERGVECNFYDRCLYCSKKGNIKISIRDESEIVLEGPLSIDYYRIQDILYGHYYIC